MQEWDVDYTKEDLGEFIFSMRKAAKLTQLKLARLIGKSNNAINKYESGKVFPKNPKEIENKIRKVVKAEIRMNREAAACARH